MLLHVQTNGRSAAACTRESDHNAGAVVKLEVDTLILRHRAVKICVREVIRLYDFPSFDSRTDCLFFLCGDEIRKMLDHGIGTLTARPFVIITCEKHSAISVPELVLDLRNGRQFP